MRRYSATYFVSQSVKGLWKNGVMTSASILVLLSCLVVIGTFATLVVNIDKNMDSLDSINEIVVFVDDEISEDAEKRDALHDKIRSIDGVDPDHVTYLSKEATLEQEKQRWAEEEYGHLVSDIDAENNPYRASFTLKYESGASVDYIKDKVEEAVRGELSDPEAKVNIRCYVETAEKLQELKNLVIFILMWFMLILFVVSLFVIINTIKSAVYARRQEISIMRYIGATKGFITLPFVFEGAIIGVISSVIAYFIQKAMYGYINDFFMSDNGFIKIIPFSDLSVYFLWGFVIVGVFCGIVGSCISLRKYMKA